MEDVAKQLLKQGYLIDSSLIKIINKEKIPEIQFTKILLTLNPPKLISKQFFLTNLPRVINQLTGIETETDKTETDKTAILNLKRYFLSLIEKKPEKPELEEAEETEKKPEDLLFTDKKRKITIIEAYEPKPKKIVVRDFSNYYKNRFLSMKGFLQNHNLENLTSIDKIARRKHKLSIIGLVNVKRITKNKNILLELEDLTGRIPVLINQNRTEVFEKAQNVVLDEIIAVRGTGSRDIVFVNDIVFPDIMLKEKKKAPIERYAVFISDLHIGSDKFLKENFLRFIKWLNTELGSKKQTELAKKVKYLFIVGDIIDGIGVYPGQETELKIKDAKQQYKITAELFKKIRKDITIIICPGGLHDAVPLTEPQPRIPKEIAPDLYALENVIMTTNPSVVRIEESKSFQGFNVLIYHGDSYDYYMDSVDVLRLNNAKLRPELIMHFLLRKRHLAPTHASTPHFPSEQDALIIKTIPDIFVSAHVHRSAVSNYNGILTIACSCWQSRTLYQEKFGHEPDPCKVPILNLKTGKVSILDFS